MYFYGYRQHQPHAFVNKQTMYDHEYYHSLHITEKLNMEANYYDIYTSSTRIYDKISFLMARFLET